MTTIIQKRLPGYMLAILREDNASIHKTSTDDLQVHLDILSTPPKGFKPDKDLCIYTDKLETLGFYDDKESREEERVAEAREYLEGQVFLVEASVGQKNANLDVTHNIVNISMMPQKENMTKSYVPIPVYDQEHGTLAEVIEKLSKNSLIGHNEYVGRDQADLPPHILYQTKNGQIWAMGLFENQVHLHGGFRYILKDKKLYVTELSPQTVFDMFIYKNVAFESTQTAQLIEDLLLNETPIEIEQRDTEDQLRALVQQLNIHDPAPVQTITVDEMPAPVQRRVVEINPQLASSEQAFIEHFKALTEAQNLQYKESDLYHYHTAMKAGGLIILGGMSGTGKSRLVTAYAQALGLTEQQFSFIPVSPAWLDEQDLLGYVDIVNRQYMPAANNFLNVLKDAADHPEQTYIVCFDEMNLAKIEHYFAQFLSVLELDDNDPNRVIQLYNEQLASTINNSDQYPAKIKLGQNIIFVGTVNFDESTHRLSNKVLDRAAMIHLSLQQFMTMKFNHVEVQTTSDVPYTLSSWAVYDEYQALDGQQELPFLWKLQEEMNKQSSSLGFGPRTVKQINRYMQQLTPAVEAKMSRGEALDEQIVSRILPKLRGDEALLTPLVGTYENGEVTESIFIACLDAYDALSDFTKTRAAIMDKAKELTRYGYCL